MLFEAEFPETAHGASGRSREKSRNNCDSNLEPNRYSLKAAEMSGKSERTIQEAARSRTGSGVDLAAKDVNALADNPSKTAACCGFKVEIVSTFSN